MPRGPHAADLPILGPCPSDVDLERDRERTRVFCDACRKDVHLLSHMTQAQAEDFLNAHAGERLCVSYEVDEDGAVSFKPAIASSPASSMATRRAAPEAEALVPATRLRRKPGREVAAASPTVRVAAAASLAVLSAACTPTSRPEDARGEAALRQPPRLVMSERLTDGDDHEGSPLQAPCDAPPVVPPSREEVEPATPTGDTPTPPRLRGKIAVRPMRDEEDAGPATPSIRPPKALPKRGTMVSRPLRGDVALPD